MTFETFENNRDEMREIKDNDSSVEDVEDNEDEVEEDLNLTTDFKLNSDEKIQNNKKEKKKSVAGVIYLSRIPPKMNVKIIREYFSRFGDVDRIYLEPRGTCNFLHHIFFFFARLYRFFFSL
jgi:ESF2/ABP1 family protein